LLNIDDLHDLAHTGIEMRRKEIQKAEKIIERSLEQLILSLKRIRVEPFISALYQKAELIRRREVDKALTRMYSEANNKTPEAQNKAREGIVQDLSKSLVEALLYDLITNLRQSSIADEAGNLLAAEKILGIQVRNEIEVL
jgi:glutamyl-tRNA reductase